MAAPPHERYATTALILTRMETVKAIQVVLVSPNDVAEERIAFEDAIKMATQAASRRGVVFTLRKWEDVSPGYHAEGAQALIDSELNIEQCDLLVGIFWKRFGAVDQPPYSRTAREILRALEARKAHSAGPDIKIYFCTRDYSPSLEDLDQHRRVLEFKQELEKPIIYREYVEVEDFRFRALADLFECLDKVTGVSGPTEFQPSVHVTCKPILLRKESLNELLPDINIKISGTVPTNWAGDAVSLDLNVFPTHTATNRIAEDGFSDVFLTSGSADGAPIARGKKTAATQVFGISFSGVALKIDESKLDADLWIKGLRGNPDFFGLPGYPLPVVVTATLETGHEHISILPFQVIAGIPVHATKFFVKRILGDIDNVAWAGKDEGRRIVSIFTVHFREAFPGAFKTREEESGRSPGTAVHGDILMVSTYVPRNFDIFVTMRDFPTENAPVGHGRAVAVHTDISGLLLNRMSEASSLVWHRLEWVRNDLQAVPVRTSTQIPLARIDRDSQRYIGNVEVHESFMGWELVGNASNSQEERELIFWVVLTGPSNSEPPAKIGFSGNLAPLGGRGTPQPPSLFPLPWFGRPFDGCSFDVVLGK